MPTFPSKTNHLILADSSKFTVKTETLTINIRLGHLDCKIKGIVCPNLNVNIIAGLNWLRQLKPVIDWESSVLTVAKNGLNYKIYPDSSDYRMKDFIFVCLVETETSPKLNLDACTFEGIHFYKVNTSTNSDSSIVKEFPDVFQETLPGLPPCREIEHKIEILGTLPKPSPIYKLSPLEDETLRNHLNNALNKNLIQVSKYPYGAAVLFLSRKRMAHYT